MQTKAQTNQIEKCHAFHKLHQKGNPTIFVNVWDAGSAKMVAGLGARALATASWAVADAHGFEDGENIPFELVEANAKRICDSVALPVSIDFESGYGATPSEVGKLAARIISSGAVGCNIEDSNPKTGKLKSIDDAVARIIAIREAANDMDMPFFINARTDVYFQSGGGFSKNKAIEETIKRADAFKRAGANGIFIPRQSDIDILSVIINEIDLPLNILIADNFEKIPEFADIGIARISMGPNPYRAALSSINHYQSFV